VCCYFQVHQPYRLSRYNVFEIGRSQRYFDDERNRAVLEKVAAKCYRPTHRLLLDLVRRHEGRFRVAFSVTGTALEQLAAFAPDVLEGFQALARTGCVEFLGETYFHSLAFLVDRDEFDRQVDRHLRRVEELFGARPRVFRNTELVYRNDLARHLAGRGFAAVLAEGVDHALSWRSPNFLYHALGEPRIKLLLKNHRLSDDIAFRFGDRRWSEHPLSPERFAGWISQVNGCGDVVNLFLDYETFGEHQWEETGIFDFLSRLPSAILSRPDNDFATPSEVAERFPARDAVDFPRFTSWADTERDLSAWTGNAMQRAALERLYALRPAVAEAGDPALLSAWERLTTSDHFYYMCTKWFADGDVHKYFNPFDSPYDAFIAFMNVLRDFELRCAPRPAARAGAPAPAVAAT
jgi:alpha-amylase